MKQNIARFFREYWILLVILAAAFGLRMLWFGTPVARDEGVLGYWAMAWSHQYGPYTDPMAANGPPLGILVYLFSAWLFGTIVEPVRIFSLLLFLVSVAALFSVVMDWYGKKTGLVSAAFYAVFMNAPIFETQLAVESTLSLPFLVFAVFFCNQYLKSKKLIMPVLAGAMASFAFLFVQYQIVIVIPLLAMIFFSASKYIKSNNAPVPSAVKNIAFGTAALALGVILPVLAFAVFFWSQGSLHGWLQDTILAYIVNPHYFQQGEIDSSVKLLILLEGLPLLLFAFLGIITLAMSNARLPDRDKDIYSLIWLLVTLAIAIPPPHFGRHFSQIIAPASILAGVSISAILDTIKFKKTDMSSPSRSRNVAAVSVLVFLLLALVTSGFMGANQYPNTNISFSGQNFYYTFSRNTAEQRELVSFLRSQKGPVMVHGWDAELYWLSGQMAPGIRWADSYQSSAGDITDADYQMILDSVRRGDYAYIVIMSSFKPDDIITYVRDKYSLLQTIGMYQVYSKFNAQGEAVFYDFIEKLSQAALEYRLEDGTRGSIASLNDRMYLPIIQSLNVDGKTQDTILQIPILPWDSHTVDSYIEYQNIPVPANASLHFGAAINPAAWSQSAGDGVLFKIIIETGGKNSEVFKKYINPGGNPADRQWVFGDIDLTAYTAQNITISFITNAGPKGDITYDWAIWAEPLLLQKGG